MRILNTKFFNAVNGGYIDKAEYELIKYAWAIHAQLVARGDIAEARSLRDDIYAYHAASLAD